MKNQYSMFASTPIYGGVPAVIEGKKTTIQTYGLMMDPVLPDNTDILYTVPVGAVERLDRISEYFYGTPYLFWVLAMVNTINDPLTGFPAGTQIRVPTKDRLAFEGVLSV